MALGHHNRCRKRLYFCSRQELDYLHGYRLAVLCFFCNQAPFCLHEKKNARKKIAHGTVSAMRKISLAASSVQNGANNSSLILFHKYFPYLKKNHPSTVALINQGSLLCSAICVHLKKSILYRSNFVDGTVATLTCWIVEAVRKHHRAVDIPDVHHSIKRKWDLNYCKRFKLTFHFQNICFLIFSLFI